MVCNTWYNVIHNVRFRNDGREDHKARNEAVRIHVQEQAEAESDNKEAG